MAQRAGSMRRDALSALYLPQVEQFGIALEPRGDALFGSVSNEVAEASVLVYRIDAGCVATSHRIRMRRDLPFTELGRAGLCVCTLSSDSLGLCPIAQPRRAHAAGNVAVFSQDEGPAVTWLRAGEVHNATSLTMLPRWLNRLDGGERAAARALVDEPGCACADEDAAALIDRAIQAATPLFGGALVSAARLARTADAVTRMALAWYEARTRAEEAAGTRAQRRLVRAAMRYAALHLDQPLALDALARDLLTSRSRLCAAFKQETGESLGAFIRRTKMERAAELLRVPALSVAEVARAVGYRRPASFCVAFERFSGASPAAWRARHDA